VSVHIRKWDVWVADLNPPRGTEPGKVRPVIVVQTDLLNSVHPSTIVCPTTTRVRSGVSYLRVHLAPGEGGLPRPSDVLVDQIRAVDNGRLVRRLGALTAASSDRLARNLAVVLG
jgi:mRNA interferase MazF